MESVPELERVAPALVTASALAPGVASELGREGPAEPESDLPVPAKESPVARPP
jgi:hypothetical protein